MLFEKKPVSDHIEISAFPSAKAKGDICAFGSLVGFSDYATALGAPGSIDIGKKAAVFQAALTDLPTAAIGVDVYITPAEILSATAAGNILLGTVVAVGADTFDIAVIG